MQFRTVWIVDAQDFSRGQGGFQGGYFTVRGVTDRDFDSLGDALQALARRRWYVKVAPLSGFDAVFQARDGRPKFLCVAQTQRRIEQ